MKDLIPEDVRQYRTQEYWEWRYSAEDGGNGGVETYDWFKGYDYFKDTLLSLLKPDDKILMLGCGNSTVSERLYQDGFQNIVNVDYSATVIDQMSRRCPPENFPKMSWLRADFRSLDMLGDGQFDVVLDKGSLDALWSDGGSQWNPSAAVLSDVSAALSECLRVLKRPRGRFISISFGQPHFRIPFMEREGWKLVSQSVLGLYYIYVFETLG